MKSDPEIERRLESAGRMMRDRPRLADRVMTDLRGEAAAAPAGKPFAVESLQHSGTLGARRFRRWLTAAAVLLLAVGGLAIVALTVNPSTAVGWPEVLEAANSQSWIRGRWTTPGGGDAVVWISPRRRVWAFRLPDAFIFNDGRERAHYEYYLVGRVGLENLFGKRSILKLPLGNQTVQDVLPLDSLSLDKNGYWLLGEEILSQTRRDVTQDGKPRIEFELVLSSAGMDRATLLVDPVKRLPIDLVFRSSDGKKSMKISFDYPQVGPTDIYALGVPRDVKIVDHMPRSNVQQVLDRMAASRASIGDFRLDIATDFVMDRIVWRKGASWRIDECLPDDPYDRAIAVRTGPKKGETLTEWFADRRQNAKTIPWYRCDGKTVYVNSAASVGARPIWKPSPRTAPQDLISGEWSAGGLPIDVHIAGLLFPDLTPKVGWGFEFVPTPTGAPGCVLIKRSALAGPGVAHEWYFIDPAKGFAVAREELFSTAPNVPDDPTNDPARQTVTMDGFQHTPQGFWYPTLVRRVSRNAKGSINGKPIPAGRDMREATRYLFDFKADMPDSIFEAEAKK